MYNYIMGLIKSNFFDCVEDGVDFIQASYKAHKITLKERNTLFKAL